LPQTDERAGDVALQSSLQTLAATSRLHDLRRTLLVTCRCRGDIVTVQKLADTPLALTLGNDRREAAMSGG